MSNTAANEKDFQILDYIIKVTKEKGFPPSVREIGAAVGLSSTATVYNRLNKLTQLGYLEKDTSKNRALKVTNYLGEPESTPEACVSVPLYGRVAAGIPITAVQNNDTIPLPVSFVNNRELFILKVSGESMIEAGIFDGDYIIIRRQSTAENGEIVVALINNNEEATVKTFYKENGHFRLQPENKTMEPIIVDSVSVIGKVVGLYRSI